MECLEVDIVPVGIGPVGIDLVGERWAADIAPPELGSVDIAQNYIAHCYIE